MNLADPPPNRSADAAGLAIFIALCLAVGAVGGAVTSTTVNTWYPSLNKPWFNPPAKVFAPVWTLLFIMMAAAGWRIWRRFGLLGAKLPMTLFVVQLELNLAWSILFFGFRTVGFALADVIALLTMIAATMVSFWRLDRVAGILFAPYVAWVLFATLLNAAIWWLN